MQTFLPYSDFYKCALCLDKKRCWKQVVEASQLIAGLENRTPGNGWRNYPASKMWANYLPAFKMYYNMFWSVSIQTHNIKADKLQLIHFNEAIIYPPWLGDKRLHESHRSNLLRKNKEFYSKYGWTEPDNLPYWWPTHHGY